MYVTRHFAALPSRQARKRLAATAAVGGEPGAARQVGRVIRSASGQIVIPADVPSPWLRVWQGIGLVSGAAATGLYIGWTYCEEILDWTERILGLA